MPLLYASSHQIKLSNFPCAGDHTGPENGHLRSRYGCASLCTMLHIAGRGHAARQMNCAACLSTGANCTSKPPRLDQSRREQCLQLPGKPVLFHSSSCTMRARRAGRIATEPGLLWAMRRSCFLAAASFMVRRSLAACAHIIGLRRSPHGLSKRSFMQSDGTGMLYAPCKVPLEYACGAQCA